MTEQRYRPLAEGEVIEEGDQWQNKEGRWIDSQLFGVTVNFEDCLSVRYRRPIPETASSETQAELTRLRAEVERLELRESVLVKRIEELESVLYGGVCNFQGQPCGERQQCKKVRDVLASR